MDILEHNKVEFVFAVFQCMSLQIISMAVTGAQVFKLKNTRAATKFIE